jgi:hypothetical protein
LWRNFQTSNFVVCGGIFRPHFIIFLKFLISPNKSRLKLLFFINMYYFYREINSPSKIWSSNLLALIFYFWCFLISF